MRFPFPTARRTVPAVLAAAMLATVIGAGLSPVSRAVPGDANCPYGNCPATGGTNGSLGWEILLVVLVLIAVALAVVLYRMRSRGAEPEGPMTPWAGGGPPGGASGELEPEAEAAAGAGAAAAVATPSYVETPEDVAAPPPEIATDAAAAAPAAGEGDIDSLMKELDKISGEILKRRTPAAPKTPEPEDRDEGAEGSDGAG